MSRHGSILAGAVGLGALMAAGGQAVFSQVATSKSATGPRVQYLCLDQRSDHWSMHGPGLNFEGNHEDFARKISIKMGNPMQEGTYNKLASDALNKLAADGWELVATNATALQYTQHVTYIFRRER